MSRKIKTAIILIVSLFLGGNFLSFIGLSKGRDIAVVFSRPIGADIWETSEAMINAFTYIPVVIGISFIILSLIFTTALFIKWISRTN